MNNDFTDVKSSAEAERLGKLYPIILEEHKSDRFAQYEAEKAFLCELFGDAVLRISHIGSTAVPKLIAKPTVDILLEIRESVDLSPITEQLTAVGYITNNPPKDIVMYLKGYGKSGFEGQTFHIHVRTLGDYDELYFRDYLLLHPEAADEYEQLKLSLQKRFKHDRDGYTAAKGDFIAAVTALARAELGNVHAEKTE